MRNTERAVSDSDFDWSDLAFGSKKPVNDLKAVFIAAPREMSQTRLKQLVKENLPNGNIIFGLAKEPHVLGFEDQPQFKMLAQTDVEKLAATVNKADLAHKVYTLSYAQRDQKFLLEKLKFKKVLFVNGSWKHMFHVSPSYYVVASKKLDYELISPFANEAEAKAYAQMMPSAPTAPQKTYDAAAMLSLADEIAKQSFDYSYQTGVALGRKQGSTYQFVTHTFNRVVPYQTYAMHHGSLREINFSPMNDLNHYDTVHAEVEVLLYAQKHKLDLKDTTLFINLLPCPNCARMLSETDIAEFVYREDHSAGYALKLLEAAGKKVRRVVQ